MIVAVLYTSTTTINRCLVAGAGALLDDRVPSDLLRLRPQPRDVRSRGDVFRRA